MYHMQGSICVEIQHITEPTVTEEWTIIVQDETNLS